jgi:hypothetical protein
VAWGDAGERAEQSPGTNTLSQPSYCAIEKGAGERWSWALSYLGRALHCSDGKVMPSRVWQKTCLCCTARRGPMQGTLHWEAEKGDVHISQVEGEAAMFRPHGTQDPCAGSCWRPTVHSSLSSLCHLMGIPWHVFFIPQQGSLAFPWSVNILLKNG